MLETTRALSFATLALVACSSQPADQGTMGIPTGVDGGDTAGASSGDADESASTADGVKLDVADGETAGVPNHCMVNGELDAVAECDEEAPADSFDPELQWEWIGPANARYSAVTPLVANLTDDNADGSIDLCDIPDIVVVAGSLEALTNYGDAAGHIHVFDGATGSLHFVIPTDVAIGTTPALGDIDDDGLPEIVTTTPVRPEQLIAFEHDGTQKWIGAAVPDQIQGAVALGDIDNDGDVEIVDERVVADHQGNLLWSATSPVVGSSSATTLADLNGDGDLEVIVPSAAFHPDGSLMWSNPVTDAARYPQVADLDDDGLPEVLVTGPNGLTLLEHDGTTVYSDLRPTGVPADGDSWSRAAAVHDFDGDGTAEYAMSSRDFYSVFEGDASVTWSAAVADISGIASGTAFDFLGDGTPEAMYGDEEFMYVYDSTGTPYVMTPRTSRTWLEYPVVADVDNDGSAEVVVVSNISHNGNPASATVQVIRDHEDRWVPARRIWNQHTYHVTNVREDGTIPQFEAPNWATLNTFRTQAQIAEGGVCSPPAG